MTSGTIPSLEPHQIIDDELVWPIPRIYSRPPSSPVWHPRQPQQARNSYPLVPSIQALSGALEDSIVVGLPELFKYVQAALHFYIPIIAAQEKLDTPSYLQGLEGLTIIEARKIDQLSARTSRAVVLSGAISWNNAVEHLLTHPTPVTDLVYLPGLNAFQLAQEVHRVVMSQIPRECLGQVA